MEQKIINLSGAAKDVLYSLFFRGALQCAELPSKSGAAELRELGLAVTRYTATEYLKESYFTFLTAEGQEFAIKNLADTRFGTSKKNETEMVIKITLDVTPCLEQIEAIRTAVESAIKDTDLHWG
ncbi:TPA: hypothetical protein ACMEJW_001728 [Klebsiella pneumoniae]